MKKSSMILFVFSFLILSACKKDKPTYSEIKDILLNELVKDSMESSTNKDVLEEAKKEYGRYFYINKLVCMKIKNENNNWKCGVESQFGRDEPAFLGLLLHRDDDGSLKLIKLKE